MKILITGATGFVGQRLIEKLFLKGHTDINILTRDKLKAKEESSFPVNAFNWDPSNNYIDQEAFNGVDTVISLAGEGVAEGRWSQSKKDKIYNSRIQGTNLLIDSIKKCATPPKKFISASAIGFYGDRQDEELTSESTVGSGFLPKVCEDWEKATLNHDIKEMNSYCLRVGIVLEKHGGALKKMLPPFKAGVAGNLGNGKQYMSWIHLDDLVGQFIFIAENDLPTNVFNGVAPTPVRNSEFTKTLGKVLSRPTIFPIPSPVLKVLFGEMSQILLGSQKVAPKKIQEAGFKYEYPSLEEALENILRQEKKNEDFLQTYQVIEKDVHQVFDFYSNEKNLEKITPPFLNFRVLGKNTDVIEDGTLIDYQLKLHGFPVRWQTRILDFNIGKSFVDEQVKGPYTKWVHTHEFIPTTNGTIIKDSIIYKIPLGILGRALLGWFIRNDLHKIFNYRRVTIDKIFSK